MADLVTINEYKMYTGISSTNQDVAITLLISTISKLVRTYCNRSFTEYYATNKVEVCDGGDYYIYLEEVPIVSIVSVERSFDNGQTYSLLNNYSDYVVKQNHGAIQAAGSGVHLVDMGLATDTYAYNTRLPEFPYIMNGYRITYKGGYLTCPEDLKLAVFDLITYYARSDMAVKSTRLAGSVGSATLEYITTSNFPAHIRRVLDMYRLSM